MAASLFGCAENGSSSSEESSSAAGSKAETSSVTSKAESEASSAGDEKSLPDPVSEAEVSKAEPVIEIDPLDELCAVLPDGELEIKEVRRLAHTALEMSADGRGLPSEQAFDKKYGGRVVTDTVPFEERYTRLAAMVMSNNSPDIVPTDDMDLFPKGAAEGMFEPIDRYIDFSSELWKDSVALSDFLAFKGVRYGAVLEAEPRYVCIYSKKTVAENGLDDPAGLADRELWTHGWFDTVCGNFANASEGKFALGGKAFPDALSQSGGVPLITMENGQILSNIENGTLAETQKWMYRLSEDGLYSENAAPGETLFWADSLDVLTGNVEQAESFGDIRAGDVMFVPVPSEDKTVMPAGLRGYFICRGSRNPQGAAAYLNCLKAGARLDEEARERRLTEVCGWNEDMIVMRRQCFMLAQDRPVLDFTEGMPEEIYPRLLKGVSGKTMSGEDAAEWAETLEEVRKQLSYAVMKANDTEPTGP